MYKHAVFDTKHYTTELAYSSKIERVNSSAKVKRSEETRNALISSNNFPRSTFKTIAPELVETLPITDQIINYIDYRDKPIKVTKIYFVNFTHDIDFRKTFFKVGLTKNLLRERTVYRIPNYTFRSIAITKYVEGEFACVFMKCLDKIIKQFYERPELILSPYGDVECFKFTNEIYKEIFQIMKPFCT